MIARGLAAAVTVATGALIGLQAPVNSKLGREIGTLQAASVSFVIGLAALVALTVTVGGGFGSVGRVGHGPWWSLLGGLFGAAYVATVLVTVRTLGAGGVTAVTIAGQLAMALVIDQFGLLGVERQPITVVRVIGLVLLAAGVYLVVRK